MLRNHRKDNKSGYIGVSWMDSSSKWKASINFNGKDVYLGLYDDPKEAHNAYVKFIEDHRDEDCFKIQSGDILTLPKAAKLLKISMPTLCKMCKNNQIEYIIIGKRKYINRKVVDELVIPEGMRKCCRCKNIKDTNLFRKCNSPCFQCEKEYRKEYYTTNKERYKENSKKYKKNNHDRVKSLAKKHRDKKRNLVIKEYGSICIKCGETNPNFLTIDHINGDGAAHRKEIGCNNVYKWLIENNFPKDNFQLLCYNCNCSKNSERNERYYNERHKRNYDKLKIDIFEHYGKVCVCCGVDDTKVLTIEHLNNNGAEERRRIGAGHAFFLWLRRNGYPKDGYEVLCYNCNISRYRYGSCGHNEKNKQ